MNQRAQKGFSVVIAVLVILVLAVLGIGGWYVWKKNQRDTVMSTDQTSQKTDRPKSEEQRPADPTKNEKYLFIKEWNLRIALPSTSIDDISYVVNNRAERDFGGPVLVDFMSKKFSAGSLKCSVIENLPRALVSIERLDGNDVDSNEPRPFKVLGNHMYRFAETGCSEAIAREGSAADRKLLLELKSNITTSLEQYKTQ
ncbi:MAG: hypothetical protein ABWX94_03475 [Candidatus Saccharimonadales bacterium]